MAQFDPRYSPSGTVAQQGAVADPGLRTYMLGVYNYMAAGLVVTGLAALALLSFTTTSDPTLAVVKLRNGMMLTELGKDLYMGPMKYVLMFAPLAFVLFLSFRVYTMSLGATQIAFWAFAVVMGLSLSSIFLVYTGGSIARIFFITAAAFGGLSLYGYTTKRDLSGWGSFLIMGVIGVIIASIVNLFLQSSALQFAISVISVLAFAGLTAYDTQQIKENYYAFIGDATMAAKTAIMGALNLYLDFINIFVSMLQLFGSRE